jgi:hypothetical protein
MRRYRTARPRAYDDYFYESLNFSRSIDVYESDNHWQDLPILGPDGKPLQVYTGPDPIGFVWFPEPEDE